MICIFSSLLLSFMVENLKKEFSAICITAVMAFIFLYRTKIALNPPNFFGIHSTLKYHYYKKDNLQKYQKICFSLFCVLVAALIVQVIVLFFKII